MKFLGQGFLSWIAGGAAVAVFGGYFLLTNGSDTAPPDDSPDDIVAEMPDSTEAALPPIAPETTRNPQPRDAVVQNTSPQNTGSDPGSPATDVIIDEPVEPDATPVDPVDMSEPVVKDQSAQQETPDTSLEITMPVSENMAQSPDATNDSDAISDIAPQNNTDAPVAIDRSEQPDDTTNLEPTVDAPQLPSATTLTLQSVLPSDVAPDPDIVAPSFDIVRVDPTGAALVAGQAAPNSMVNIISGGEIIARTTASPAGEFVAFLDAPSTQTPSTKPDSIQFENGVNQSDGAMSQAQVIILPMQQDSPDAAPVVVLATRDSVRVIQPSGLSVPENISLDSISYDQQGAVVLAGRGHPDRIARIYADDELIGAASISSSGSWGVSLQGLKAGRYVLRVDEIAPDGSVSSRVESPFQREFPAALAPAISGDVSVIVQPGNTLWLMATEAYGDGNFYTQIFAANNDAIRDPDLIYPGQVFKIPEFEE